MFSYKMHFLVKGLDACHIGFCVICKLHLLTAAHTFGPPVEISHIHRTAHLACDGVETGLPEENIFTLANGDVLILRNEEVFLSNERVQADAIFVDGNDISGVSTAVLKDRQILGDNGLVSVIVAIDSRENKILTKPVIVSRGFVFIKDSQLLLKEAEQVVYNALKEKMKGKTTFGEIKNTIRGSLEPFLYGKTHRNPIVIPVILNSKEAIAEMQKRRNAKR